MPASEDLAGGLAALEAALEYRFAAPRLLEEALTHRSTAGRPQQARRGAVAPAPSYERLEFLGDRVLGLVVAEMLLAAYPREAEGDLARRHAQLVRKETLAEVAEAIGLSAHIRLPPADEAAGRANPSLAADVCEAVIAALYLDGGFTPARGFVTKHWTPRMQAAAAPPKDPKTGLQEWAQGQGRPLPIYTLIDTQGPPHQPVFTVEVAVEGLGAAAASGASKRLAESAAAAGLLQKLQGTKA
jgi:ribonuclease-3